MGKLGGDGVKGLSDVLKLLKLEDLEALSKQLQVIIGKTKSDFTHQIKEEKNRLDSESEATKTLDKFIISPELDKIGRLARINELFNGLYSDTSRALIVELDRSNVLNTPESFKKNYSELSSGAKVLLASLVKKSSV
jgi:hypothetical protein